jgi:glutathione peroxidase
MSGHKIYLRDYKGQVLLLVNIACGGEYAEQLAGLQALYAEYGAGGFTVVGFPCGQFSAAAGGNKDVLECCRNRYGVRFPLAQTVQVKGKNTDVLFKELCGAKSIKGDFTKFLISSDLTVIKRFDPETPPEGLTVIIEEMLKN